MGAGKDEMGNKGKNEKEEGTPFTAAQGTSVENGPELAKPQSES